MKTLQNYILEKLKITKSKKVKKIKVSDRRELVNIVRERVKEDPKHIDLTDIDVSELTSLDMVFYEMGTLESIDVSNWDVSNVRTTTSMFHGCSHLKELDLSEWEMPNLEESDAMFYKCALLKEIDFNFMTYSKKLIEISHLVAQCASLESLPNIESINTSNVVEFRYTFDKCYNIKELDLSSWDVSKGKYFMRMFADCMSLKKIEGVDKWNLDGDKVNIENMFADSENLNVDLSTWKNVKS